MVIGYGLRLAWLGCLFESPGARYPSYRTVVEVDRNSDARATTFCSCGLFCIRDRFDFHVFTHICSLFLQWFQYCVVRTGLVHLKYLQIATAAVAAWKDEDFAENETARSQVVLLQEARGQVDVHTATLELGQLEGIRGKDGRGSYWFRSWLGAVKESDLALSG